MKYTPSEIVKRQKFFSIPIYQRLFEWNTENIVTLLEDLKKEYDQTNGQGDYYIGMLTSTAENELVDGQQRFTVMMLLGCVLQDYYSGWQDFLSCDNKVRLNFSSRPLDNTFLMTLIEHKDYSLSSFKNSRMQNGCEQIRTFMTNSEQIDESKRTPFAEYVFQHLSFFVSYLPQGYCPQDLNKYFERMNTSGKNLEQHEILKVKILSNLDQDVDKYMSLWNKLADVDSLLIHWRKDMDMSEVKCQAINSDIHTIIEHNLISGLEIKEQDDAVSIKDVVPSSNSPKNERELNRGSRCALTFPYLLLQVLYRKLGKSIKCHINDFFKPSNLISIFEEYLPFSGNSVNKEDIKEFMEMLVKARLALDICFVRSTEYGYSLDMNLDEDNEKLKRLMMFQSMLFVSSSNYTNYRWFNWLMDAVDKWGIPDADTMYRFLKEKLDKEIELPPYEKINYEGDNRYWFWRLDFYIWQHRKELFEKDSAEMNITENYIFRRNRSIEHVAPQTPQTNSDMKWEQSNEDHILRDSFGNLVMISQGLNSSLSNESYEVKHAHVESFYNGSKTGTIESLKLLLIYHDFPKKWDKSAIEKHGTRAYEMLVASFTTE